MRKFDIFASSGLHYMQITICGSIAKHSGTKLMDMEGLDPQKLIGCPPLMPWQKFAEWIGMGDEPIVVRTWIDRGYLPSLKVGKRVMVNLALLTQRLLEEEHF